MKILNLYAGLGGNRKLWDESDEITAVEINPDIATIYADLYSQDKMIVGDAHEYLLQHHKEYDFVWASPPCQSHSSFRQNIGVRYRGTTPEYPDMRLYQEILFLQYNFDGLWVVENVNPYYAPLIKPTATLHRHLFWSNFYIRDVKFDRSIIREAQIPDLQEYHDIDLGKYSLPNKRQALRNCVLPEVGEHILDCAKRHKNHAHCSIGATLETAQPVLFTHL